ncbi:Permease of the major facilitator superfamily [Nosema bombycis CQ1]|nr:Permease of the major facilitator superfamily [Nosema bombycis CQ1]|eukprot:EOB15546.1 Permease of the major facilitator superfamily [Nosema bombycis CQ1]
MVRPIFKESSMKSADVPAEVRASSFKMFFFVNMVFTGLTLLLFFYMYGIVENVLFDNENAQKKLDMYVEKEQEEEKMNKIIKETTVTNK